ncbi:MAG: 2Fe-2S iron-sulfur cluster binding domain-containing protein, partial [Acetobacteraceae bacterium]|nr:2Fe-2S iron-sulfur cluster binding domain-containing protein [Acetobacteraceae bacterium]
MTFISRRTPNRRRPSRVRAIFRPGCGLDTAPQTVRGATGSPQPRDTALSGTATPGVSPRYALVAPGTPLLDAARLAGVVLDSPCGGRGVCGKCRVRLSPATAGGEPTPVEVSLLTDAERCRGWRLACQARVEADLTVLESAGTGYAAAKAALGAGGPAGRPTRGSYTHL